MKRITKKGIESIFCTEENIGIFYSDYEGDSDIAMLPGGFGRMGNCTNCAHYIASKLDNVRVAGFYVGDNPTCKNEEVIAAGGHDFAIVEDRYIVDIWISLYTGDKSKVVYDCLDPRDRDLIIEIYGDPNCWKELHSHKFDTPKKPLLLQECFRNINPQRNKKDKETDFQLQ